MRFSWCLHIKSILASLTPTPNTTKSKLKVEMETQHIIKSLRLIIAYPRVFGFLPITYDLKSGEFAMRQGRSFIFIFYVMLSWALIIPTMAIWSFVTKLSIDRILSSRENSSVLYVFVYFPLSCTHSLTLARRPGKRKKSYQRWTHSSGST